MKSTTMAALACLALVVIPARGSAGAAKNEPRTYVVRGSVPYVAAVRKALSNDPRPRVDGGTPPTSVAVLAGTLSLADTQVARVAVKRIVVHPDWKPSTNESDIALLELATPVVPGPNLQPIGYATASDLPKPGATLTVSGWGATKEGGAGSTQLLTVDVPVVDLKACNDPKSYDGVIARSMVCAGREQGGKDSCQGDSGGPAVLNATTEPLLAGIVSWGHGCARPWKYGIYTRVGSFAPWVKKTIGAVRPM